jgi:site-specific DNA-cytosine methylase
LYAVPLEFSDLIIRKNAHVAINDNAIRGVQDKNNASCAENFYQFTDTKANTLTTAHRPKIIDELSNYTYFAEACEWNEDGEPIKAISYTDGKKYIVYKVKDGKITIKEKQYPIKLYDGYYIIRKLTVSECKRLQTVPEWYQFPVSDTQAYKMLGNGWTIDVIVHLIEATKIGKTAEKIEQLSLF